jgi:hypothetical protein
MRAPLRSTPFDHPTLFTELPRRIVFSETQFPVRGVLGKPELPVKEILGSPYSGS